jgi:iron complex transport system permease protein
LNHPRVLVVAAFVLLMMVAVVSLGMGAVSISPWRLVQWLLGSEGELLTTTEQTILFQMRLPRIVSACLVGGSLAAAGVGFQGLFRNPLADPYVIGASSGASLGVTLAIVLGLQADVLGFAGVSFFALVGAIVSVVIVFSIGTYSGVASGLTLLLAGVALSSMINAIVSLVMFMNDEKIVVIFAWLMGSLANNDWNTVIVTSVSGLLGGGLLWAMSRPLDANLLGDRTAQSLGLDLMKFRMLVVLGAGVATAGAVAAAGIVGFIGLIAPHIARRCVGPRHAWLLPMSVCVGAMLLLVSDNIGRSIVAPSELPVGIVTALLGCPFFLFLLKSGQATLGRLG